jgi:ubiquinone/menaquinone biosynthesis C-methylase UbiE
MPDRPSSWSTYRDLDSSPGLEASVAWLSRVAALEPLRAGKQRSHELLQIKPGDRVLDIGCGTGVDVLTLAAMVSPGGEAVGIDSSDGVLAEARRAATEAGLGARFELVDAAALPFPDEHFDACRCDRTLQHLPDPHRVLNEMVRVTRPGGTVLISEGRNHVKESDGCDLPVLRQVLALHQTPSERTGWIGFMLPLLLGQAGVIEVAIESVAGRLASADEIVTLYDLQRLTQQAVDEGQLAPPQVRELFAAVKRESAGGRLHVVLETHIFFGRVPIT